MGYQTYFSGSVEIEPPLNEDEVSFLKAFNQTRRMHRSGGPLFVKGEGVMGQGVGPDTIHDSNSSDPDQPGLWCQWAASEDGTTIEWDDGEKFYYAAEWMEYIVNKLLSPAAKPYIQAHINEDERLKSFTCDHVVNGEIYADGEEADDFWKLKVTDNLVEVLDAQISYGDEEPVIVPPTEAELREALRSLGAPETRTVTVWSLTIDENYARTIVTKVLGTEQECFEHLLKIYSEDSFDITTDEGRSALVEWLIEDRQVVLYIEEHTLEVPA